MCFTVKPFGHKCGELPRALLANWSLCCLNIGANLDALAASAASLWIHQDGKSVLRLARALLYLGEAELCRSVLNGKFCSTINQISLTGEKKELLRCTGDLFNFIKNDAKMLHPMPFAPPKYLPLWIGSIEAFDSKGPRGRGVRATIDLKAGQVVLIEPPIAFTASRNNIFNITKTETKMATDECILQAITVRARREGVLSNIIDFLHDGVNTGPTLPMEKLSPTILSCKALLPSLHDYMDGCRVKLTTDRIGSIISVNSFGQGGNDFDISQEHTKSLYSACSMFNHSSEPTCFYSNIGGCILVFTRIGVKSGSELTVCYHPDEDVVRKNWGVC